MFRIRTAPKVTDFDMQTGIVTVTAECKYHETPASFTKTMTAEQHDETIVGEKYYAQIFYGDPDWNLADIELFFISGMCDECWSKMCDDDEDEPVEDDPESFEYLKREAITADRFDHDFESYEESDEDYKS